MQYVRGHSSEETYGDLPFSDVDAGRESKETKLVFRHNSSLCSLTLHLPTTASEKCENYQVRKAIQYSVQGEEAQQRHYRSLVLDIHEDFVRG